MTQPQQPATDPQQPPAKLRRFMVSYSFNDPYRGPGFGFTTGAVAPSLTGEAIGMWASKISESNDGAPVAILNVIELEG